MDFKEAQNSCFMLKASVASIEQAKFRQTEKKLT